MIEYLLFIPGMWLGYRRNIRSSCPGPDRLKL